MFGAVQKCVYLVDLVKSFPTSILYLLAKIGVDTAENEPSEVSIFSPTHAIKFHTCIPPDDRGTVLRVLS